ncbi:MAG: coproporphyrinogen dehydrogenase HemZ [Firmicutes bacterium]|nr:coproporphyrinogen dehydrogenase HemZ [Bacillota bacterium]
MFRLETDAAHLSAELSEVIRLFTDEYDPAVHTVAFYCADKSPDKIRIQINGTEFVYDKPDKNSGGSKLENRMFIRFAKIALYKALKSFFKRDLAWGSLTGIRPTKLAYELIKSGVPLAGISQLLQNNFFVSRPKADLTALIIQNQSGFYTQNPHYINLYVHVPFCPSRCSYCSFVSVSVDRQQKLVEPYVEKLCVEIQKTVQLIRAHHKKIYSVYIGGGTPTVLSDTQFARVLNAVTHSGTFTPGTEFTCEAGRPETITAQKIALMKNAGVTRISVNPQSLNPQTLHAIGRNHTAEDFFNAYRAARDAGFNINTDIIAGLYNETPEQFLHTLTQIIRLKPHNITVHTLSRKRGSALKENRVTEFASGVAQMTHSAQQSLMQSGYLPYYLYRQKLSLENLENIGYCLPDTQCVNNITVMEEMLSVAACGAGAISKLIFPSQNRIERLANIKDVKMYLERFDEQMHKKEKFLSNSTQE